jgi:hypothetical protein
MPFRIVAVLAAILCSISLQSQQPVSESGNSLNLQAIVDAQFGAGFTIDAKFKALEADFDFDGAQDLAVVATGKNPLANSLQKNFKVVDPYDAYFGFGDARITAKFSDFGDGNAHCVLIIHDWHAEAPKGKFVLVNVPFEKLELSATPATKKPKKGRPATIVGLSAQEGGGLNAFVFWDGKKYRWEPVEFSEL